MSKLILIKKRWIWYPCYMCGYFKPTKEYQKGNLKLDLCEDCFPRLNKILDA